MAQPLWQIHLQEKNRRTIQENMSTSKSELQKVQKRIQASVAEVLTSDYPYREKDIGEEEAIDFMVYIANHELKGITETAHFAQVLKSSEHREGKVTLTNNFHSWLPLATYRWDYVRNEDSKICKGANQKIKSGIPVTLEQFGKDIVLATCQILTYLKSNLPSIDELSEGIFEEDKYPHSHPFNKLFYYNGGYRSGFPNIFECVNFMIFCRMIKMGYERGELSG